MVSIGIGELVSRFAKLPDWTVPAVAFNNTTSLPLLLIQSLSATGILNKIIITDEPQAEVIERAKTYFLVCAIVGNCLTFALGPRLLDHTQEHIPDEQESQGAKPQTPEEEENGEYHENVEAMEHARNRQQSTVGELTPLMPSFIYNIELSTQRRAYAFGKKRWDTFSPRTQSFLLFIYDFVNAPFIGAVIGVIIGLTPPLHRAFFNSSFEGGFLNAWLTSALSSVGNLFVSLQVVVVGVTLASSLRKMKRGEASGEVPIMATVFVLGMRLIIWPIISITLIWLLATKTNLLGKDPILWFAMMLMPTGPPAIKLVAMADVTGASEDEKMSVSKLLVVSLQYACNPVLVADLPFSRSPTRWLPLWPLPWSLL